MTRLSLLAGLLLVLASPARGADDPFEFFEQEARVVTAAKRLQPADEVPASVDVITRRDIEASGAADLCDLLRFRPGLDVIDGRNTGGSNRCVVSIRGMARDQVRELMVLVDGHSVYSPLSGVILWEQLPVQLQDIERIEIVRGPNAALYGSGAGLGVINIITRSPQERSRASVSATGGSLGTALSEEELEGARGAFSYRLSHTFREQDGYPTVTGLPSNDFLHSQKAGARAVWRPAPGTTVDAYAGGSWDTMGLPTGFGLPGAENHQARFRTHFETLHVSRRLDVDSNLELSLTRLEQVSTIGVDPPPTTNQMVKFYRYDLEAQHAFGALDGRLHTTWGGELQYAVADSPDLFGTGTPVQVNRSIRGFVHQTARLTERFSLVGGASLEQPYFIGSRHADYQAAALYEAAPGHVFRLSYSLAHTNPGFSDVKPNFSAAGGNVQLIPNDFIKSYELANYETGWRGSWLDGKAVSGISLYYTKIRDHVNIETIGDPNANPLVMQYDNSNYLIARGLEVEQRVELPTGGSLYANYSQEVVTDRDSHTLYIKTTPKHIVNVGFSAPVAGRLSASANAGWKDGYLGDSVSGTNQVDIPPFWRLDARLSYAATKNLDLFVGGRNLLTARHVEFVDGLTVPRTFYGGVRARLW